MKKLNLDLDKLVVESFETSTIRRSTGTVRAFGWTETSCDQIICDCGPTNLTCETNCDQATCGDSCVNFCPTNGEHTCDAPTCFNSCTCISQNFTACCVTG